MAAIERAAKGIIIALIEGYRWFVSPLLGPSCRFYPTCSTYAVSAIREHGIFVGLFLVVIRIAKCQPLHPGGFDPVPRTKHPKHNMR